MNVRELFEMAIADLRQELPSLGKDVGERTLMARLAHHMASLIEMDVNDLKVDCEYNRYLDEIKTMPRAKEEGSGTGTTNRCFPDVIVHRRKDNSQNLLVAR